MAKYKALVGIDYPPNKRAEAGDVIDDLDGKAIKWLLDAGLIEPDGKTVAPVVAEPEVTEPVVEEPAAEVIAPDTVEGEDI